MPHAKRLVRLCTVAGFILLASMAVYADDLVQVSDPASQKEDSNVSWGQLGPDQTQITGGANVSSNKGLTVSTAFSGPTATALISKVCSTAPPAAKNCSWTGTGFPTANSVLWATDGANGGNGPITLTFAKAIQGAGAFVQTDAPGLFTASIQAFNGSTPLGQFTAASDAAGDAVYIGLTDNSGTNITSVVFSLTACSGKCADFALDNLHLNAVAVLVSLSTSSLAFGPQLVNTASAAQTVTLNNVGNEPVNIASIAVSGDFAQTNTCGTSVPVGGSCGFSVTFTPTGVGNKTGTIDIKDNSQDGDHKISLSGTGTEGMVSPSALSFGTQAVGTPSVSQNVSLSNAGTTAMHVLGVAFTGTNPGDYSQINNCGAKLDPGASCTFSVTFTPQSTGPSSALLQITDDGGKGMPEMVTLSGIGQ